MSCVEEVQSCYVFPVWQWCSLYLDGTASNLSKTYRFHFLAKMCHVFNYTGNIYSWNINMTAKHMWRSQAKCPHIISISNIADSFHTCLIVISAFQSFCLYHSLISPSLQRRAKSFHILVEREAQTQAYTKHAKLLLVYIRRQGRHFNKFPLTLTVTVLIVVQQLWASFKMIHYFVKEGKSWEQ